MPTRQGVDYRLRVASLDDEPALRALIARSIRALGADDYAPDQIEAALTGAFGIDTSLIQDGTSFVVVNGPGGVVGCGGRSRHRALFGSDARTDRDDAWLDPAVRPGEDPMRSSSTRTMRDVDWAAGSWNAARRRPRAPASPRSKRMATLPGQRLYTRCSIRGLAGCSSVPADAKSIHLKGAGEVDGISR